MRKYFASLLFSVVICSLLLAANWQRASAFVETHSAQAATATPAATAQATRAATSTATPRATPVATQVATAPAATQPSAVHIQFAGDASALTLADLADYDGLPTGFTAEGFPFIGDPQAPVTMSEFSDYLCPFCQRHFLQTTPALIDEYVLTGKLRMVFRDFPIPSLHPAAPAGHVAARCVGEAGAPAYWAYHDQLFVRQSEWNRTADPVDFLMGVAEELGLDADALEACIADGAANAFVTAEMAAGMAQGFSGTPTFVFTAAGMEGHYTLVGAYPLDEFRAWIDALVAGEAPAANTAATPTGGAQAAQLPLWATEEGLAAADEIPGYNAAGDAWKGSADAPVTIVTFSDYQCPACAQHALQVQPALDEELVDTGLVRWVSKNRPLAMHPYAPVAAAAAECAAEQGMYWEMHRALFTNMEGWAPNTPAWEMADAEAGLLTLAQELDLESAAFATCLSGRAAMARVLADVLDAEGLITSTPSFVVLYNGQGTILSGSRPAAEFVALVESILEDVEE